MSNVSLVVVLLLVLLAGCGRDAPDEISFQQHVLPILAANCVRCHADPVIGGAPDGSRLDSFEGLAIIDPVDPTRETTVSGAMQLAQLIAVRVTDPDAPMPPRFPLDDDQIETLERWAESPVRGAPRPNNHVPSLVVTETSQLGAQLTVEARVDDLDHDLVVGVLRARVGGTDRIVGSVRSGTVHVPFHTAGIAPGVYPLVAHLDDGAQVHVIDAGSITVEAP